MNSTSRQKQSGFTMIELLVSIIIFGLLTSSVFYFLSQQNTMSVRATDSQRALSLAKLTLDSLKVAPFNDLTAGVDTLEERYIRSWRISVMTDGGGMDNGTRQVDLTVYWPLAALNNVSLATLVSDDRFKEESTP